ncbi:MAG: hypothetical protein PVJ38_07420 [Candidatus Bathyarchaeota archaeon]|jgi:hypothetical protein
MSDIELKPENQVDAKGLEKFAVLYELRVNRMAVAPSSSIGMRGKSFPFI